jgi:uncharacterized membrane protein
MYTLFFGTLTVIIAVHIILLFIAAIGIMIVEAIAENTQYTNKG